MDGLLLYDNCGVYVYLTGYVDDVYSPSFELTIVNQSSVDISLHINRVVINDAVTLTHDFYCYVEDGQMATAPITFYSADLELNGIERIGDVGFYFGIDDMTNYTAFAHDEYLWIATDDAGYYTEVYAGGECILDRDGLRIVLQ